MTQRERVEVGAPDVQALVAVHADAADLFRQRLASSWVPAYLASRSLGGCLDHDAVWVVGYAPPSWIWLTDRLRDLGYSDSVLEGSGLSLRTKQGTLVDRFRDRLTLGIRDRSGAIVAFTCRAAPDAEPQCPKYLNSPTTKIYRKSEVLFGLGEATPGDVEYRTPVLVEGPLDAIAVDPTGTGRYAPLAACGTTLTAAHADLLATLGAGGEVVVALDADGPGRLAAAHALDVLRSSGIEPWALALPDDADPADLVQRKGPGAATTALDAERTPLVDLVVENCIRDAGGRLRWVEGRVATARAVMPLVARCSLLHAARLASKVARLCDLAPETVADELAAELQRAAAAGPQTVSSPAARPGPHRDLGELPSDSAVATLRARGEWPRPSEQHR